jgi:hypothetical protein
MRALLWIALAGFATQLPARDVANSWTSSAPVRQCHDKAHKGRLPATGEPVLPFMRLSQSVA